jgi:hypothetical protein
MMMRMMTKMKKRRIEGDPMSKGGQATRYARRHSPNPTFYLCKICGEDCPSRLSPVKDD